MEGDLRPGEKVFTAADVRAWRDGNWYFVTLDGEVIHRRHTRDESFTEAWVVFYGNRSPDYPKARRYLERVELRGPWRYPSNRAHGARNRLSVPIER